MIQELSVQDFAIISSLNLEFKEGMTVLTGETGAGKSIIIDAMGLLVGGRGSSDFIRDGMDRCRIEGSFYIENKEVMLDYLEEKGIEMPDDLYDAIEHGGYDKDEATKHAMFAWLDHIWQQKDARIERMLEDFKRSV